MLQSWKTSMQGQLTWQSSRTGIIKGTARCFPGRVTPAGSLQPFFKPSLRSQVKATGLPCVWNSRSLVLAAASSSSGTRQHISPADMLQHQPVPIDELQNACCAALAQLGYDKDESALITEVKALLRPSTSTTVLLVWDRLLDYLACFSARGHSFWH